MRESGVVRNIEAFWLTDGPHLHGTWPEFTHFVAGEFPDERPGPVGIWRDGYRMKVKLIDAEAVYVRTGEAFGPIAEVYELERLEL